MEVPNYSIWCRLHVHSVMSMAEVLPSKRSFVRLLTLPWRCRLAMPSRPLWSSTRFDLKSCWRRPLASYKFLCIYLYIYIYLYSICLSSSFWINTRVIWLAYGTHCSIQGSKQRMTCPTWKKSRTNGPMRQYLLFFYFPPIPSLFYLISKKC